MRILARALCTAAVVAMVTASGPVAAQSVPGAGGWAPGAGAVLDNTYEGFIDQPRANANVAAGAPFQVSGWAVDTTAEGWSGIDSVQVLEGGRVLAQGSVGGSRPDVASVTGNGFWAASGFGAVVPAGALGAGAHTLTVAIHTPAKGTWTKQVTVNVGGTAAVAPTGLVLQVISPSAGEDVAANNNGTIHGVAYDTRTRAELGSGVDRVQVYIDAERGLPGSQFLGETVPNGTTWSVEWQPTKFDSVRHHVMFVYARSSVTGEEKMIAQEINIVS